MVYGPRIAFRNVEVGLIQTRIGGKHRRGGVGLHPLLPGRDLDREEVEPYARVGQWPDYRLAGELMPQGLGLVVVHNLVAAVQQAGCAECGWLSIDLGRMHDSVPQSVQYARAIGSPPSTSFAISWALTIRSGYALCSPLMETPNTRSSGKR